jgi:hypothetical protein
MASLGGKRTAWLVGASAVAVVAVGGCVMVTESEEAGGTGGTTAEGGSAGAAGIGGAGGADDATQAQWARTVLSPTTSSSFGSAAVDPSGNVYAAGDFRGLGTFDLGDGVTTTGAYDGWNLALVKYDSSGTALWVQSAAAGSIGSSFGSVAVDASANVYAAGSVYGASGSVDFGNGVTVANPDTFLHAVLVRYDSSGTAQWAQAVTAGSDNSTFSSLVVDASGNVYAAGEIDGSGTYDFGNGVTATGTAVADVDTIVPRNVVLVKYDSSGVAQWAQTVRAGSPESSFDSVAVDSAGSVYAAGYIADTGTYDFGNGVTAAGTANLSHISGPGIPSVVLVKYSSSGIAQWARTVTAAHGSWFSSVAVDPAGNVYAAGAIGGPEPYEFGDGVTATGTLGSGAFTGLAGPVYVVLVKYDSSGIAQWARTVTNAGPNSVFYSVAVDSSGNVYAAGEINDVGTYDFGNGAAVTNGTSSNYAVLVAYDPSGMAQWARSSVNGGSSATIFTSVTVDSSDHVYATGAIGGPGVVDFGSDATITATAVPSPGWSALLVRYQ